jgi:osmoprotectant transport system permease protein
MKRANPIILLGGVLGGLAMLLPWLSLKPNRLLAGQGIGLTEFSTPFGYVTLVLWITVISTAFLPKKVRPWLSSVSVAAALLCAALYIGRGAAELVLETGKNARVSPSSGAWLGILAFYISLFGLSRESRFGFVPSLAVITGVFFLGTFNGLGPWLEYAQNSDIFSQQFLRHMLLSLFSVALAALLGFPLGVWAVRSRGAGSVILAVVSFLQTVPSVALFGLLLPPLASLGRTMPSLYAILFTIIFLVGGVILHRLTRLQILSALTLLGGFTGGLLFSIIIFQVSTGEVISLSFKNLVADTVTLSVYIFQTIIDEADPPIFQSYLSDAGVRGIGAAPALFALSLYALLPLVINTVVGLNNVPESVKDAARGMGMSERQIFWRAEVPLALPFMFEGLRSSLVLTFGLATIAALISAGGLGFFILRGVEGSVGDLILLGAVPVVVVALLLDLLLRGVSWFFIPKGLRT